MTQRTIIIGLTGGIGMGKSTAAKILSRFGLPIYSADAAVHTLLGRGGKAVNPVAKLFPASLRTGAIDRKRLGADIFHQPKKLRALEKILHPLVRQAERDFLKRAQYQKARAAVLEIPLLFETGGEKRCDFTICVTAPRAVQTARVLSRKNMTPAKFKAILTRQMPDAERRARADYIVKTGVGLADTKRQLEKILRAHQILDKPNEQRK